MIIIC